MLKIFISIFLAASLPLAHAQTSINSNPLRPESLETKSVFEMDRSELIKLKLKNSAAKDALESTSREFNRLVFSAAIKKKVEIPLSLLENVFTYASGATIAYGVIKKFKVSGGTSVAIFTSFAASVVLGVVRAKINTSVAIDRDRAVELLEDITLGTYLLESESALIDEALKRSL